jgi:hypothetical protein
MIVEQLKTAFGHWTTGLKVEPVNHIEKEFPLEKEKEEAVIIEIEFDDKEESEKSPEDDPPPRQPRLSIWV